MKNFKEIAEKCLAGELSGVFVFQNGQKISSSKLQKFDKDAPYGDYPYYIDHICTLTNYGFSYNSDYNVIDFIPDKMTQKKIEIDIPEGKVPVMEQTEKGVFITWKEKEITYADVISKLVLNQNAIYEFWSDKIHGGESAKFYKKVEVLRKLINIRNYFGKSTNDKGYGIFYHQYYKRFYVDIVHPSNNVHVCFSTKVHAEQAIKMLGDELKYLFEPW